MNKGKFVAIEGPDGCGKSTIVDKLKEHFEKRNSNIKFTREPGGTEIGEKIRGILLDPENIAMTEYTEAYLYAAARLQHTEEFIIPNLNSGCHVISDRYAMASVCYQGYGREKNAKLISHINQMAVDMVGEVNYIVLMISPEEGIIRKKGQKSLDRLELETLDFHKRVFDGYEKLIEETGAIRIDASKSIDETVQNVLKALEKIGIEI